MKRHEFMRLVGAITVGPWLVAVMLVSAVVGAHAQADQSDNEAEDHPLPPERDRTHLVGSRGASHPLRYLGLYVNTTTTARGTREQIVYNRYFYVYLDNGVVTSVRKRRQIFTGFKIRP